MNLPAQSKHPYPAPRNLVKHSPRVLKEGKRGKTERGKTERGKTNKGAPLLADFARSGNFHDAATKDRVSSHSNENSLAPIPPGTSENSPALSRGTPGERPVGSSGFSPKYNVQVSAPPIEKRWICVADRGAVALAAVVSSYLFERGTYLPLFTFPAVIAPLTEGDDVTSEAYLSNAMGSSAATFINNAWARMHGSRFLILAGLSADQISYLSIPKGVEVINVPALTSVHEVLKVLPLRDRPKLKCK